MRRPGLAARTAHTWMLLPPTGAFSMSHQRPKNGCCLMVTDICPLAEIRMAILRAQSTIITTAAQVSWFNRLSKHYSFIDLRFLLQSQSLQPLPHSPS